MEQYIGMSNLFHTSDIGDRLDTLQTVMGITRGCFYFSDLNSKSFCAVQVCLRLLQG